jgi:hypothetical protein
MPINRPFIDSHGTRGASFIKPIKKELTSRNLPKGQSIQFMVHDEKNLQVSFPTYLVRVGIDEPTIVARNIKVTKRNAIRLAHWLLDNCT